MASLIGFTGKKGAGKNAASNAFPDHRHMAFADPLKNGIREMFGFTHAQLHGNEKEMVDGRYNVTPRDIMQFVGTDMMRDSLAEKYNIRGIWVQRLREEYQPHIPTIITDVRFEDEAKVVRELGGILVRIERPGLISTDQHQSEQGEFDVDLTIVNNRSLEELQQEVRASVKRFIRQKR